MSFPQFVKDPNARLDYGFDWTQWLNGRTISTSTWKVPTGLTNNGTVATATTTTIILSGGTVGKQYNVSNQISCTDGTNTFQDERTLSITIDNR